MGRRAILGLVLVVLAASCGDDDDATSASADAAPTTLVSIVAPATTIGPSPGPAATEAAGGAALNYVAFGDSWPEGAHCNGCTTFAGLWAEGLEAQTGRPIAFTDLTGKAEASAAESKASASLLGALQNDDKTRAAVQAADIILIATGPNEIEQVFGPLQQGTCGGTDGFDCIRDLGALWSTNFEAILTEIETLRDGEPTAIRLVNAANPFVSVPEMNEGMPEDFATTGGALMFELLTVAMCDAAAAHDAACVDIRPLLNGPTMDQPVDENSPQSMQAITDALVATELPEIGS